MLRKRVLIAEPTGFSPRALAILGKEVEVVSQSLTAAEWPMAMMTYDAVWLRLAHRIDGSLLRGSLRCRALATAVTGLDHIDLDACKAAGVAVVSLKGETEFLKTVRATAELTVGLMLGLMRKIPAAAASVRGGDWARDRFRGNELYGKVAGVVGVGRLGKIVAGYLSAFGMKVIGYDPFSELPDFMGRAGSLAELMRASDVVSLHVSYQPSTHHLVDATALAAMKPSAFLVNTSRGGVVDEEALLAALDSKTIAGAALDVLSGEPAIDATHPVVTYSRTHDNVLIVPHIGGNTFESFEKTEAFIAEKLLAVLR
ncbi:MAG: hypothetical protein IPJ65_39825 [Archangiaceae bacterium]|nr:hypothetical protein [Archangiaceae bacterium]